MRKVLAAFVLAAALVAPPMVQARQVVPFRSGYGAGTIIVETNARRLYYVLGSGQAIQYPVGVGRAGMAWHGHAYVAQKLVRPAWTREPGVTPTIPGGDPRNPMGEAVLGLDRGNYAIHGTNNPASIGGSVSHGCIRMYNADIVDLYRRVGIGAEVYVLK